MADFRINLARPPTFFVQGEVDMATVPVMTSALAEAIAIGGPITLDVSDMAFVDSAGVKAILETAGALPSGCLVLHGVHDGVQRVLDVMGADHGPNVHIVPCTVRV